MLIVVSTRTLDATLHRAPHDELAQLLDQDQRVLGRGLGEDEHELLAAVAAEDIAGADAPGDETRQLPQHGVADPVAVRVVDRLEAVDVHEGHRQRLGVARRALDLADERAEQRLAVRDPGQPIAGGLRLGLGEGAGGPVEGPRQPPLGRNARLLEHDGLALVDGLLQVLGQPPQAEAEVAPGGEGHGRGAHADGQADEADHEPASLHRLVDEHHAQQGQAGGRDGGIQEADQAEKPEQARPPRTKWSARSIGPLGHLGHGLIVSLIGADAFSRPPVGPWWGRCSTPPGLSAALLTAWGHGGRSGGHLLGWRSLRAVRARPVWSEASANGRPAGSRTDLERLHQ